MEVVDFEPNKWFLLSHKEELFLDANCNHSCFGYSFLIKLTGGELNLYKELGRGYLDKLAYDIHYSAPIVKNSKSIYRGRDLSKKYSQNVDSAITDWKNSNA